MYHIQGFTPEAPTLEEAFGENWEQPAAEVAALNALLAAVSVPQPNSPAETRTAEEGITTDFNLATNPECHYSGHATIADGTLRLCEFAILNKSNTHETRVHHVETPSRILSGDSDVGPVWVSELQLAVNHLAPFLLTAVLKDRLVASAPARVSFFSVLKSNHHTRIRPRTGRIVWKRPFPLRSRADSTAGNHDVLER